MKEITSLPNTAEKVDALTPQQIVDLVLDLANPINQIKEHAGMQLNTYLSFAAVKLARAIDKGLYIKNKESDVPELNLLSE